MVRLVLLLSLASLSLGARGQSLGVAPDAAALAELRERGGERGALSMTNTARTVLARRILEVEPGSALAHAELALRSVLDYEWRRRNAERRGIWTTENPGRAVRRALLARATAREHIRDALAADPEQPELYRLAARLALIDDDNEALSAVANEAMTALPADANALLFAGLAAYRSGQLTEAESLFDRAASALDAPDRDAFGASLFVRLDERRAWEASPASWEDTFWRSRDPWLLTPENERRLEHAARLVEADLLYAPADRSARGWMTDRGETYVRYGKPNAEVLGLVYRSGAIQQWVYDGFSLGFEDWFSSGDFSFQSSAHGLDDATRARSLAHSIVERPGPSAADQAVALPVVASRFRGKAGGVDLVVAYGVPVEPAKRDTRLHSLAGFRSGAFALDALARRLDERQRETGAIPFSNLVTAVDGPLWADAFSLRVPPGDTELVVEVEQSSSGATGRTRMMVASADLSGSGLRMSDVVLALDAGEIDEGGRVPDSAVRRGMVWFRPSPLSRFDPTIPLRLFAEVYGLSLVDGRAAYSVEAKLDPVDDRGALRRLFSIGNEPGTSAVSVAFEANIDRSDEALLLWLDSGDQPDGKYLLTVTVRDMASGTAARSTREIELAR